MTDPDIGNKHGAERMHGMQLLQFHTLTELDPS